MLTKARNLLDASTHRESEASPSFGVEMRCIGAVWRGTPLEFRRRTIRRPSERCSHPSGIGASRRRAPELDSKVSHPFSNPGVMTAPLIGTVFQTRHDIPVASSKSRLATLPSPAQGRFHELDGRAQSWSIGVVSLRERSAWARSVLLITQAMMATPRRAQPTVQWAACELTTGTPRAHGIGLI